MILPNVVDKLVFSASDSVLCAIIEPFVVDALKLPGTAKFVRLMLPLTLPRRKFSAKMTLPSSAPSMLILPFVVFNVRVSRVLSGSMMVKVP